MFITKLLDLFKPKPAPAPLPASYPDAEFMEAVAKNWRARYASHPATSPPAPAPPAGHDQAA